MVINRAIGAQRYSPEVEDLVTILNKTHFGRKGKAYLRTMNFLAHLALSQDDEDLLIGNAIADFTRKKFYDNYTQGVQLGISLHHFIDDYTDTHPVVKEMLMAWRPRQGKYAGVVNDIVMDHFLARDFEYYRKEKLADFANAVYTTFRQYWGHLPERAQHTFRYMEKGNWLLNYQHYEGIERSLGGMSRRAQHENRMAEAVQQLKQEEAFFKDCFEAFYPDLEQAVEAFLLRAKP